MANKRNYKKPYYPRRPAIKWLKQIKEVTGDAVQIAAGSSGYAGLTLVQNAVVNANPTPVILKCTRFTCQCSMHFYGVTANPTANYMINAAIVFVPEQVQITSALQFEQLLVTHPEWVLATKHFGPSAGTIVAASEIYQNFTISSTLSRNLNSGDEVRLYVEVKNQCGTTIRIELTTLATYYTRV